MSKPKSTAQASSKSPNSTKPPTSNKQPPPAAPPTKTRSIKAGLKGVVVQRKRSKAGAGGTTAEGVVAGGRDVAGEAGEAKSPIKGQIGVGDGVGKDDGELEGGDRKRRRVE